MIFQEPMVSLNPLHTIGKQICETLILHRGLNQAKAKVQALALLSQVQIKSPERQFDAWPHQLSGGQRQRAMIAMALANDPDLLIADEPTTAVDVTTQAQILALINTLCRERNMALLLITHDLGVVEKTADRVYVMQGGRVIESGATQKVFNQPSQAYTRSLIEAEPSGIRKPVRTTPEPILEAEGIGVWFPIRRGVFRRTVDYIKAVDNVHFSLRRGSTLGIVGESGSGKTTLALALLRLTISHGSIKFEGHRIDQLAAKTLKGLRRDMQIVFQDPYGSLNPRMMVGDIIAEGIAAHHPKKRRYSDLEADVITALEQVNLDPDFRLRYPHEFSGGQRQRIALARALILKPRLIVLDEPTSALDRSVQSQMVDLLTQLQAELDLTYIFISHDLRIVRALADDILVMRSGRVVEHQPTAELFNAPREAYTRALIQAAIDLQAA
jgi:microcin C transport system ATP-binding protein